MRAKLKTKMQKKWKHNKTKEKGEVKKRNNSPRIAYAAPKL